MDGEDNYIEDVHAQTQMSQREVTEVTLIIWLYLWCHLRKK